jgi:hypothetical protein
MLGARESTTPLIETIILRDDHLAAKSGSTGSLDAGPLPHLACIERHMPQFLRTPQSDLLQRFPQAGDRNGFSDQGAVLWGSILPSFAGKYNRADFGRSLLF